MNPARVAARMEARTAAWRAVAAKLPPAQKKAVEAMLRVDHAGEVGANSIYAGQLAALRLVGAGQDSQASVQEMWEQEKVHERALAHAIGGIGGRPSALRPLWEAAGFAVGAGTALMGARGAMACTAAVEEVIGSHYNDQIRELLRLPPHAEISKLVEILAQFRDDELQHRRTALEQEAEQAPLYGMLVGAIQTGCRAAIWIAKRL